MTRNAKTSKVIKTFKIQSDSSGQSGRNAKESVKKRNLTSSSKNWVRRQINDAYAHKAKEMQYRARSAFKLIEINQKFNIFTLGFEYLTHLHKSQKSRQGDPPAKRPGALRPRVLDLGCAPGSWIQVTQELSPEAKIVGVDLLEITDIDGIDFIQGDFCGQETQNQILSAYSEFEVVLSDIAPNTTGNKTIDHLRIASIIEEQIAILPSIMAPRGCFVSKAFHGGAEEAILKQLKQIFQVVRHFKPKSSRKESNEIYIICLNFKK